MSALTETLTVVPVVPITAADDEATKAVVRHEFGSLDDCDLPGPVLTRFQARAERSLHVAIRAAYGDGRTVPCLTDPATWDADSNPSREEITRAARLCRTTCPVFDQCTAFLATEPPVCGIIAGRFVPHPADEVEHRAVSNARKDEIARAA